MDNEKINQLQFALADQIPWINGISTVEDYHSALEYLTMLTAEDRAQPFYIRLIAECIDEYESKLTEELILKNGSGIRDNGLAALTTLMGRRKTKNLELVDVLGSKSLVSQIMNGKRALTIPHIYALAEFFNVKPSVFL